MQLIRSVQSFGGTQEELVHLWKNFCRSVLEQSCVIWGPSLTQENIKNLERTQKTFAKLILKEKYKSYDQALVKLNLDTLERRRQDLCLRFAKDGIKPTNIMTYFQQTKRSII